MTHVLGIIIILVICLPFLALALFISAKDLGVRETLIIFGLAALATAVVVGLPVWSLG